MTNFTIIDKDGTETNYPSTVLYHEEQELVLNEVTPTQKKKKEFYLACLTLANAWFGVLLFCIPCIAYISEKKLFNVGGLFWAQTCIIYGYFVICKTYKELKKDLEK